MYLKSLTLRGFKSFASATSLRFEPGITCVVGPNGSGKSNVVDAFSWVMGEQGVKNLRGGKMEDVVFAGTASRPPLGRAEVTLTIDNSDGALPIEYSEVTISRLLFRSGQSEYAINGDPCRLLDVQELLSDSGLGREMHVIVGQGQLDEVLHAGPEARRALIEEAAGVLKHRKRKEKALRKLEAMQVNLTRLVDLTAELRRRLKPLGRQAAIARRAAFIQAELRDARLRLLADDFVTAQEQLRRGEVDEAATMQRRERLEQGLADARRLEAALDADEQQHAPRLASAQQAWFELSAVAERLRSVAGLARERHLHLSAQPEQARPGRDPDELEREATDLREQEAVLGERLEGAREQLADAAARRTAAEAALADAERTLASEARAAAAQAEQLARLRGQLDAARSRAAAANEEAERLEDACEQARARAETASEEHQELQDLVTGRDDDRTGLVAEHERAMAEHSDASARVGKLRGAEREASSQRAALRARAEALEEGISAVRRGAEASAAILADPGEFSGVLGSVATMVTVADGAQEAIAAALGAAADAVAVAGLEAAVAILEGLKGADAGSAGLVIAAGPDGAGATGAGAGPADLPAGAVMARDLVEAPAELAAAIDALLAGVAVTEDLGAAAGLLAAHPTMRIVTRAGDLLGAYWAQGGSGRPPSALTLRAAADDAASRLREAEDACERAATELAGAAEEEERARQAVAQALNRMQEADGAAADLSGRLGRLAGAARAAQDEATRLEAAIAAAWRKREGDLARVAELTERLARAEAEGSGGQGADGAGADEARAGGAGEAGDGGLGIGAGGPDRAEHASAGGAGSGPAAGSTRAAGGGSPPDRTTLAAAASAAREAEMEARLEVRTAEERLRAIAGRADALVATAQAERQAAQRAIARRAARERSAAVAHAVTEGARIALEHLTTSVAVAAAARDAAEQTSRGRAGRLKEVRSQVRELAAELDKVVDSAHGAEIARAERRMRVEQLATRAAEEFGVEPAALAAEYGPDVPIPLPAEEPAPADARNADARNADAGGPDAGGPDAGRPDPSGLDAGRTGPDSVVAPEHPGARYVRAEQERRASAAQRQLDQLGKVNPLALEEFAALEERHAFLNTQLEDLKNTRRDLLMVIKEVDDRVQQVFASAYEDTAREFEQIFGRLFPGGQGRLVLTEPDDMLATGIDFEARPPGKKVKRLSLLSGGERSLTAIAYLLAIFKARPSPFYVLDEVEAALDDTNIQRLLRIFEELRDSSQLIVVTHQMRTMEIADALYGISMRGDGVSAVVSQRLRERETT